MSLPVSVRTGVTAAKKRPYTPGSFVYMSFQIFSFLSRKILYSFMLEARVKWLTALLVQHYEAFHPDLVALNR